MILGRDAVVTANDLPVEDVEVKEWGGTVRVRALTGTERDAWEQSLFDDKGKVKKIKDFRASFLVLCLVDDKGNRLFKDNERDLLSSKSSLVLSRLFTIAQRLNGMGQNDMEVLEKNLEGGQSADSTSG